jgi:branched-chain amino acid transport system permease protein
MKDDNKFKISALQVILVLVIIALPLVVKSNYVVSVMLLVAIYGILSIGMGLLLGQAGLFSLAHPTWFGLGAYISGILSARGIISPLPSIFIAAASVALIAYIVGISVLRLRGPYLACATFAIILVAQVAAAQLTGLTGGPEGLVGIPALSLGKFVFKTDLHFYYLSWAFCLGCYWFCSNLINSRIGRAMRAFHNSETASQSIGINVARYKIQIFVLTAVMASFSGSIFCFYLRFVVPDSFGFPLLIELLMMIIIGGIGYLRGALIGTFMIFWLIELIHGYFGKIFPMMTNEVDAIFFGILIILILIFMPRGLTGGIDQLINFTRRCYGRLYGFAK